MKPFNPAEEGTDTDEKEEEKDEAKEERDEAAQRKQGEDWFD